MLYGLKDCANITAISKTTGNVALYADYAKTSTIEFSSEEVFAYNKGTKAIAWNKDREGNFKTTMELFNMDVLALLFGSDLEKKEIPFLKRVTIPVVGGKATIDTTDTIVAGSLTVYKIDPSDLKTNIIKLEAGKPATDKDTYSITDKSLTLNTTNFPDDEGYVACYYMVNTSAQTFTVTNAKFPGNYEIYGDTMLKNTSGVNEYIQFKLENVKPQSNVTLTMDVDNVCSLEITWEIMAGTNGEMMTWSKVA